jgi:hypothetical protein
MGKGKDAILGLSLLGAGYWWVSKSKDENRWRALRRQLHLDGLIEEIDYLEEHKDEDNHQYMMWEQYFYDPVSMWDETYEPAIGEGSSHKYMSIDDFMPMWQQGAVFMRDEPEDNMSDEWEGGVPFVGGLPDYEEGTQNRDGMPDYEDY